MITTDHLKWSQLIRNCWRKCSNDYSESVVPKGNGICFENFQYAIFLVQCILASSLSLACVEILTRKDSNFNLRFQIRALLLIYAVLVRQPQSPTSFLTSYHDLCLPTVDKYSLFTFALIISAVSISQMSSPGSFPSFHELPQKIPFDVCLLFFRVICKSVFSSCWWC